MKSVKKLTMLAILTTIALTIFVLESAIPPIVPIPGIKLGLANIVTLVLISAGMPREAARSALCPRLSRQRLCRPNDVLFLQYSRRTFLPFSNVCLKPSAQRTAFMVYKYYRRDFSQRRTAPCCYYNTSEHICHLLCTISFSQRHHYRNFHRTCRRIFIKRIDIRKFFR